MLNRAGFDSYRNRSKAWRPQRIKKDGSIHEMDRMRLGSLGQSVNSTGCFGVKSSGSGVNRLSYVVKRGAPGKRPSQIKRKNTSRLFLGDLSKMESTVKTELYNLRAAMMSTMLMVEERNPQIAAELKSQIQECTDYLIPRMSKEEEIRMLRADQSRIRSIKGMTNRNANLRNVEFQINRAKQIRAIKI